MSKNDLDDAIKNLANSLPNIRYQINSTNKALQDLTKPIDLGDPNDFAPNRTANNTEQMVELLKTMSSKIDDVEQSQVDLQKQISIIQEANRSNDAKNLKMTYIIIGIGILTLIATVAGICI